MNKNEFVKKVLKQECNFVCRFLGITEEQYNDYCSMEDLEYDINNVYEQMPEEFIKDFELELNK